MEIRPEGRGYKFFIRSDGSLEAPDSQDSRLDDNEQDSTRQGEERKTLDIRSKMATMTIITEQRSLCIMVEKFQREALSLALPPLPDFSSLSFVLLPLRLLFILHFLSRTSPLPYLRRWKITKRQLWKRIRRYRVRLENSSIPVEAETARGAVIKHWRMSRILKREILSS